MKTIQEKLNELAEVIMQFSEEDKKLILSMIDKNGQINFGHGEIDDRK